MTGPTKRNLGFSWFIVMLLGTSIFYVVLLRQFGALPEVRRNANRLLHLEAEVDSLRKEMRRVQP
mgnify:CR=1 FL=1